MDLLTPLRLPMRLVEALESVADAAGHLGPMRSQLILVREQTEPLAEVLPALGRIEEGLGARLDGVHEVVVALEGNESHLNKTVRELVSELTAMHATLSELQDDVQRITDRLPDPEARGPLQKAREALTAAAA